MAALRISEKQVALIAKLREELEYDKAETGYMTRLEARNVIATLLAEKEEHKRRMRGPIYYVCPVCGGQHLGSHHAESPSSPSMPNQEKP